MNFGPFEFVERLDPRRLLAGAPWNNAAELIGQDQLVDAFPALTGVGQVVAVIDTGIDYTNPRLGGGFGASFKVIDGYDFVDNDSDPIDTDGHGTAVAGMIAANAYEAGGKTWQGIAPDAKLVALRIAPDRSTTPNTRIAAALQWVIDRRAALGITVVNISFGTGHFDREPDDGAFATQLAELADAGVIVTAASGNGGIETGPGVDYPAADSNTIAVGAVDEFDSITEFTERGKLLDLLAPGDALITPWLGDTVRSSFGTSFAAPIVAGAAALLKQQHSEITLSGALSVLQASGRDNFDGDGEIGATTGKRYSRLYLPAALQLGETRLPSIDPFSIPNANTARNSSLGVDAHGVLHAAYYDVAAERLNYATRSPEGVWSNALIIDGSGVDSGQYVSLALDSAGRPGIAYFDATNGDLRYARFDAGDFSVDTIDWRQSVGLYPTTRFNADNRPAVAYYHRSKGDLRYAEFDGSQWTIADIDRDPNDRGRSASMAVNSIGRFSVAYEDTTTGKLKIARQTAVGWTVDTIDNDTTGVAFISTVFDSQDDLHVSYYDASPADLKYASERANDQFGVVTVSARGAVGLYSQLLLDGNDNAEILYYTRSGDTLNLATGNLQGMNAARLTAGGGKFVSMAADPRDGSLVYAFLRTSGARLEFGSVFA